MTRKLSTSGEASLLNSLNLPQVDKALCGSAKHSSLAATKQSSRSAWLDTIWLLWSRASTLMESKSVEELLLLLEPEPVRKVCLVTNSGCDIDEVSSSLLPASAQFTAIQTPWWSSIEVMGVV